MQGASARYRWGVPSLHALFVLAWALLRTLLSRMLGGVSGLAQFHANYDADRLPAASESDRRELPSMSGCIACGVCDWGAPPNEGAGPMDLALASSRSSVDADAAARSLESLDDELLAAREKICPTRVPLVAIARLTRGRSGTAPA